MMYPPLLIRVFQIANLNPPVRRRSRLSIPSPLPRTAAQLCGRVAPIVLVDEVTVVEGVSLLQEACDLGHTTLFGVDISEHEEADQLSIRLQWTLAPSLIGRGAQ